LAFETIEVEQVYFVVSVCSFKKMPVRRKESPVEVESDYCLAEIVWILGRFQRIHRRAVAYRTKK
jgi:hypothetical protein